MKQHYLDFIRTLSALPVTEEGTQFDDCGSMIHITHGARFGFSCTELCGIVMAAIADPSLYEGLDDYLDDSVIPGSVAYRGLAPVHPDTVEHIRSAEGENGVLSALISRDGIGYRQTVFTFDGGVAVLICGLDNGWTGEGEMPVFEHGVFRCFCHPDRSKVYKNTTTHGGIILRTLMDDVKPNRHIRPSAPDGKESRNLFTAMLQTSPLMPCIAYEMTTVGMGFGCQLMANSESCQAIMLSSGDILSFDPVSGKLTRF